MNTSELAKAMHMAPDFYGVVPCCEIEQYKKHEVVGLIVNTDPHNKPGTHWIALYKKGKTLNFFDSFGREMQEFAEPFASIMDDFASGCKVKSNKRQYQNVLSDTCGRWTLYYILSKLCGVEVMDFPHHDTYENEIELARRFKRIYEMINNL